MSIAKILMQIKKPGDTMMSLKKEVEQLTPEAKETLIGWYNEEHGIETAK